MRVEVVKCVDVCELLSFASETLELKCEGVSCVCKGIILAPNLSLLKFYE